MTTELFTGMPLALKTRIDVLIAGGKVINFVIVTSIRAEYLIIYT